MKKYKIISRSFLLGCCILLAGCEKMVEFDVEKVTPYVVVHSKPEADSSVQVRLAYSRFFLDNHAFRPIGNAEVQLYANGQPLPRMSASDGCYRFDGSPKPGDSLTLQVRIPGYDLVEAGTSVPSLPDFEVLEALYDSISRSCRVKVRIHDPKGRNYYRIAFEGWEVEQQYGMGNDTVPSFISFSSEDMVFTDATSLDYLLDGGQTIVNGRFLSFSDALFDGKAYTMEFDLMLWSAASIADPSHPFHVRLSTLSRERYLYDRTLKQSFEQDEFLSEPVQIYTNVKGGIGIFAAAAAKRMPIQAVVK